MNEYQKYIAVSRYCRWLEEESRRETWEEAVDRYIDFFAKRIEDLVPKGFTTLQDELVDCIRNAVVNLEVMPSMRCLMTAGPALDRDNVAGYNCSYLPVDHPRAFDEMLYILCCGTGVGFSVERQYINKLPEVAEELYGTDTIINIADSKIGWAKGFRELVSLLYAGQIPKWDTSSIRPAGSRLKTFGGRASGPEPLEDLFKFTVNLFRNAAGRKLTSIECHDLCCKIAEIVVVGGVRRSALISLSNPTDDRLRRAKHGQWWDVEPQRALANNSACYTDKPDFEFFLNEWGSLYESKSGERGIFSRPASVLQAERSGRRDTDYEFGTNPCSEIILRPNQFCNLSEAVVRREDRLSDIKRKVRLATILGTLQSTLTDFRYLRKVWEKNTEEERLLGVSLTGIMDHPMLSGSIEQSKQDLHLWLQELKEIAIETNKEWAEKLGIEPSTAITCVKPSGTVSQLVDSSSGIHPRFARYYIRRVRADSKDPLARLMVDAGLPYEEAVGNPSTLVFEFPQKAPEGCTTVKEVGAMDQVALWKVYQDFWCEHKPSCTVYYTDDEFLELGQWVYNNFDAVSGISFLPVSEHTYRQAPYEEITEEQYNELVQQTPEIPWERLSEYELEDATTGTRELACVGTSCEWTDA